MAGGVYDLEMMHPSATPSGFCHDGHKKGDITDYWELHVVGRGHGE